MEHPDKKSQPSATLTHKSRGPEALQESELPYRQLVEMMNEGLARADADYVFSYVNRRFADMLGYPWQEMINRPLLDFVHPDDQETMRQQIARRQKGESKRYEVAWRSKDDRKVYTLVSPRAEFDDNGSFAGSVAVLTDITDRKLAEQALRISMDLESLIMRLSTEFINLPADQIDDGVSAALRTVGEFTEVDRAYVFLFRDDGTVMDNTHEWCAEGVEPHIQRLQALQVHSFPWFAERMRRLETVYVARVSELPPEAAAERKEWEFEGIQSLICVPMLYQGSLIGFLGFDAIKLSKWWPDDNVALLKIVGSIFANALQRKATEQAVRESEERFRATFDSAFDAIIIADDDGHFVDTNDAACELFGLPKEKLLGKRISDFMRPEFDFDRAWAEFKKARRQRGEVDVVRPDGKILVAEFTGTSDFLPGQNLLIWRDVSTRKKAEEALRRSEENFRAIFDHTPGAIFGYDRDGVIVEANDGCERLFGFKRDDLLGRSLFETISVPKDHAKRREAIARVFSGETVEGLEWEDRKADGSTIYVLSNTTPVYDTAGQITMGLSLNIDITERKLAEQRALDLEAHKRDFYRRTILAATEGKLLVTEKDDIERIAGPPIASWEISKGEDLAEVRQAVGRLAEEAGMDRDRIYDFVLAVGEATTNAYKHAGGGTASLHKATDGLFIVVSDKGPGIEALVLPEVALVRGYSTAGSLGMGYKAILSISDKVYLATGPSGTTVGIALRLHPAPKPLATALLPDTWTS